MKRIMLVILVLLGMNAQAANNVTCNGCVGTADVKNQAVTTAKLKDDAVTVNKIKNWSVSSPKLRGSSVTTNKIKDGAVTAAKIADNSVSASKVSSELKNDLNSACPAGQSVFGKTSAGEFLCEQTGVSFTRRLSTGVPVASAVCDESQVVLSVACDCDNANGARNFGLLFGCQVIGNGGVGGCYPDAGTYSAELDLPAANITVTCANQDAVAPEEIAPAVSKSIKSLAVAESDTQEDLDPVEEAVAAAEQKVGDYVSRIVGN